MAFTKQDTTAAAIVGLLLLGGAGARKAFASTPGKTPAGGAGPKPPPTPEADGAALLKRANQANAHAWAVTFVDNPSHATSPLAAAALARWAGIESSGKATNRSRLDERGLMQAGPAAVTDGELTQAEFDQLIAPSTTKAQHAALAIKYVDALANKAMTYVPHPPSDPVELIWYAKLWHQRPVDVRDAGMTGDAIADARRLAVQWAADAKAMHRLRAANVVAWGTATP